MILIRNLLTAIGAAFVLASCVGSFVSGMNFHVVLANDATALKWHEAAAEKLRSRIKKEQ